MLDIQDELQTLYTSGTVFHAFLGEKLPDWKAAASLVRKIAENYRLPYYTISPTYSVCQEHGYLAGEQAVCPHCGKKTEVYSRITGYYRPVQNWNDGKAQEFKDRKVYVIGDLRSSHPDIACECEIKQEESKPEVRESNDKALLFASVTCPNCKLAANMLEKAGYLYKKVIATENIELTNKYGVKQAPTLVIVDENGNAVAKYRGVSEIKGMLMSKS